MFCKFCGSELNEHAAVCTHCGCAIDNKKVKTATQKKEPASIIFTIINYSTISLLCLSLCFLLISIVEPYLYVSGHLNYSYYLDYYYIDVSYFLHPMTSCFTISFVFFMCTYLSSAINFVFSFKQENRHKRFLSDILFIIVNCLLPVMIVGASATF